MKSILDGQLALGGIGSHLDLGGVDLNFISSVRHPVDTIYHSSKAALIVVTRKDAHFFG